MGEGLEVRAEARDCASVCMHVYVCACVYASVHVCGHQRPFQHRREILFRALPHLKGVRGREWMVMCVCLCACVRGFVLRGIDLVCAKAFASTILFSRLGSRFFALLEGELPLCRCHTFNCNCLRTYNFYVHF